MKKLSFDSPYVCMVLVLVMYLCKAGAKMAIGAQMDLLAVFSDGAHNLSDMAEASIILYVIHLSSKSRSDEYPIGRSALEPYAVSLVGLVLLGLGIRFFADAVYGLVDYFRLAPAAVSWLTLRLDLHPPRPPEVQPGQLFTVIALLSCSILLSCLMSGYQRRVGRRSGHASLVADGTETLSDALVETGVLASIAGAKLLGAPWLDFPAALIISFILLKTAGGLLSESFAIIQNRSVGTDTMETIRGILDGINEIEGFDRTGRDSVKGFRLGNGIFLDIKIYMSPRMTIAGFYQVKRALHSLITARLDGVEPVIHLRPSLYGSHVEKVLVPLARPALGGRRPDGVLCEHPRQAEAWVVVEALDGEARYIRSVDVPPHSAGLAQFMAEARINRLLLAVVQPGDTEEALPGEICAERVPFLTLRDMFH